MAMVQLALQNYADRPDDGEALRGALRVVAAEARDKSIFPEQLLTTLKDMWHELPGIRAASGPERARLLQHVVTISIKEYYSL